MKKPVPPLHVMYPEGLHSGDLFIFWSPEYDPFDHDLYRHARHLCVTTETGYQYISDGIDRLFVDALGQGQDRVLVVKVNIVPAHLCDDSFLTVRKEETSRSYTLACSVCGREKSYDIIVNKSAYP